MARRLLALVTLAALALGGCTSVSESTTSVTAGGAMTTGDRNRGQAVYATNCAVCHGKNGMGAAVGPSLRSENERLDYAALVAWIEDPQAPMPKLYPQPLSRRQVFDVAAYVQSL